MTQGDLVMKCRAIISTSGVAFVLFANSVFAMGVVKPHGPHYNVNIVAHPNLKECARDESSCSKILGGKGAYSGGSALFIPLVTDKKPRNADGLYCTSEDGTQTKFEDDVVPTFRTMEPDGKTRIYFEIAPDGDGFKILDRVADKNGATIQVPVTGDDGQYITLDLWVRVLGKPGGCAEITGYAEEETLETTLWWYSGSIVLNRKAKKSEFVYASDIFNVWHCTVVPVLTGGYECANDTKHELSVFDDMFNDYFWEVRNYNTRLIQMRFYYR